MLGVLTCETACQVFYIFKKWTKLGSKGRLRPKFLPFFFLVPTNLQHFIKYQLPIFTNFTQTSGSDILFNTLPNIPFFPDCKCCDKHLSICNLNTCYFLSTDFQTWNRCVKVYLLFKRFLYLQPDCPPEITVLRFFFKFKTRKFVFSPCDFKQFAFIIAFY